MSHKIPVRIFEGFVSTRVDDEVANRWVESGDWVWGDKTESYIIPSDSRSYSEHNAGKEGEYERDKSRLQR